MRALTETLFWIGRLETVTLVVLVVHSLLLWRWRHIVFKRWLAAGWLALFIVLSVALFPGLLSRATGGTGYVIAHLHGNIWNTDEALTNILLRWRNLWLPIYVPWLGVWLVGLMSISLLPLVKQRLIAKSS